ncbi:hypothetical protein HOB10_04890 [Candidatus Parcubacteria bacterium]|jgi:hypothetical protein|nr:hypothetical protein [Candidatus Parcubacteria bacterium]
MKNNKKYLLLLGLIIVLGFCLRYINIGKHILWVDEAETVINTIQVIEDGYPHGYFKGQPIHENISYIKIEDPVYRYASTNYYGSKYENNKGWLTYFYLAPFIKTFGFSELSSRLPFLLFYILTTIVIFFFTNRLLKNKKIALVASLIFAIDILAIYYGKQARYYSIFMFLGVSSMYLNYLYIHSKKNIHLWLLTTSLILTFHTHITLFAFLVLFYFYYDFIRTKKIKFNKAILYNALYLLVLTVPWLILVKFWVNFTTHDVKDNREIIKVLWLLIVFLIPLSVKLTRVMLGYKGKLKITNTVNDYLATFSIAYIIFVPIIIPAESITSRVFAPLIPIFAIIITQLFYQASKKLWKIHSFFIITTITLYIMLFMANGLGADYGNANYINTILKYTEEKNLGSDDIIVSNWNALSLKLYSDHQVYPVRPLRPDFFNNYPNRILAVFVYKQIYFPGSGFTREDARELDFWLKAFNEISDRLKTCKQVDLGIADTIVLDCPALK